MATQAERSEETQGRILETARALFVEHGIDATTTDMVLAGAGVSRGAMYHHFAGREALIAAVYEREAAAAIERGLARVPKGARGLDALIAGCLGWLDEVRDADVARIVVQDGVAALGWQQCRAIDERHSLGVMRAGVAAAVESGELHVESVELVAKLLNALLAESALAIIGSRQRRKTRAQVETTMRALVAGLRASPSAAR